MSKRATEPPLKFAQALQYFFVHKVLTDRYTRGSLMRKRELGDFFRAWYKVLQAHPDLKATVPVPVGLAAKLTEASGPASMDEVPRESFESALVKRQGPDLSFAEKPYHPILSDPRFTEFVEFLRDENLGELMRIPYPTEEETESLAAALAAPDEEKVQSLDDLAPIIERYRHMVQAGRFDEAQNLVRGRLIPDPLYYRFGAYGTCIELLRALFPDGEDRPPRLNGEGDRAWTLNELANSYSLSGQPRRAVPLFEMQIGIREKAGDKKNHAIGLGNLALDQVRLGQLKAAEGNLGRRIALCREVKNEFQEAIGHQELGRLLAYRGEYAQAATELETALDSFTRLGDSQAQCVGWAYRGLRALLMGDCPAALEAARQALNIGTSRQNERDRIRAEWLIGAALVAVAGGEKGRKDDLLTQAEGHLTDALTRCRKINLVETEPDILLSWARWHRANGNAAEARRQAEEALSIAERSEYRLVQADGHNLLARLALDEGDKAEARKEAEAGRERAFCDGPPYTYKPALDEAERILGEARG